MLITRLDVKIIEVVSKNKSSFQLINLYPNSIYGVSVSPPSTSIIIIRAVTAWCLRVSYKATFRIIKWGDFFSRG